jgi:hypothetical protein
LPNILSLSLPVFFHPFPSLSYLCRSTLILGKLKKEENDHVLFSSLYILKHKSAVDLDWVLKTYLK